MSCRGRSVSKTLGSAELGVSDEGAGQPRGPGPAAVILTGFAFAARSGSSGHETAGRATGITGGTAERNRGPKVLKGWGGMGEQLGKILVLSGVVLAVAGAAVLLAGKLGIGRLPGDLLWQGENWTVYVPLGWMILLSVILTILLNVFLRR